MSAKWRKFTKEELNEFAKQSYSNAEFLRKMGYAGTGGNTILVMKNVKETYPDIDFSHFTGQLWSKGKNHKDDKRIRKTRTLTNEEVFCKNSKVQNKAVRLRLKELIEYKCDICGMNGEWYGHEIMLEIDHINGINNDNRIENLRFLCPNCHATTPNYKGRNVKR